MATIGLLTVGVAGCVYSGIEIARRLGEAGHRVVFASTNSTVHPRVTAAGYECVQLDDGIPESLREQRRALPPGRAGARGRRRIDAQIARARGQAALSGFGIEGFLRDVQPDLVLLESELHDCILFLLGRALDVPVALLEYHVSVQRRPGVPPLSATYTPRGAFARLASGLLWRKMLARRRLRRTLMRWRSRGWDRDSVWARVATASGVALRQVASRSDWPILHYRSLPRLQLSAPEFDFPPLPDDNALVVGPVVQSRRSPPDDDAEAHACRALLDQLKGNGRPLVACATGSILTLPRFVRGIIAAAEGAGFDLVIATGRGLDPACLENLPANVHAFRRIPQLDVLEHAALFVCHCGIASVHEAILAGVPILACSGGVMDENGNAARVEFHGLGVRGSLADDNPQALRRKIETVLGDAATRERVRNMRETLLRYSREQRLLKAVESVLESGGTSVA